jgi:hypothetical protein
MKIAMPNTWDACVESLTKAVESFVKCEELKKIIWSCVNRIRSTKMPPEWVVLTQDGNHVDFLWKDDLVMLTKDSIWWRDSDAVEQ